MQPPPQTVAPRRSSVAAWVLYVLCLLAVAVVMLLTGFLTSQAASGCSLVDGPRPSYCSPGVLRDLVGLFPLGVGLVYALLTPVLIVLLRARPWVTVVPLGVAFLAATAMVVSVAVL